MRDPRLAAGRQFQEGFGGFGGQVFRQGQQRVPVAVLTSLSQSGGNGTGGEELEQLSGLNSTEYGHP
jgi:hypothetical protein